MGKQKRVMLIDKSQDVVEIITFLLTEAGHEFLIAQKPFQLSEVENYNPDLIFLHTGLNGEGAGICKNLKSNYSTSQMPILLSSTLPTLPDIAEKCKADAYISKPFDVNELMRLITKILSDSE